MEKKLAYEEIKKDHPPILRPEKIKNLRSDFGEKSSAFHFTDCTMTSIVKKN